MANLFVWLAAAVGPLAKQVLVALGIGWVSYAGVTALLDVAKGHVISNWSAIGGTTAQLLTLGGWGDAVGILLGGLAARAALMALQRLGKVAA